MSAEGSQRHRLMTDPVTVLLRLQLASTPLTRVNPLLLPLKPAGVYRLHPVLIEHHSGVVRQTGLESRQPKCLPALLWRVHTGLKMRGSAQSKR
jgi:hypothetical protein